VVSLAAPGSTIYSQNPGARVGTANFAGSGTSFSAAITSGAAALVLAHQPRLTPNQLKARLLGSAGPGPVGNPFVDGHGALDAYAAATSGPMDLAQSTGGLLATLLRHSPTVSLAPTGPADSWNTSLWTGLALSMIPSPGWAWNGTGWDGSAWNGATWSGSAWDGSAWDGSAWNGASWQGADETGRAWNGG
jgi:serine protease AprX